MTEPKTKAVKAPETSVTARESAQPLRSYVPAVDILETKETFVIVADVPGADEKSAEVTVENNVLAIEVTARGDVPEGATLLDGEFGPGVFRRRFDVGHQIDRAGVKARLRNGALTVTIPKKEEARARKIEIAAE